jgi:hypothetical protein
MGDSGENVGASGVKSARRGKEIADPPDERSQRKVILWIIQ